MIENKIQDENDDVNECGKGARDGIQSSPKCQIMATIAINRMNGTRHTNSTKAKNNATNTGKN